MAMLLALKLKAGMTLAALAGAVATAALPTAETERTNHLTAIAARPFVYRLAGDFSTDGRPVDGPVQVLRLDAALVVMTRQVTAAEYEVCVLDGGCPRLPLPKGNRVVPMTGVSWHDASAYATWISRRTGRTHRLPTDEEWTFAAAERARDEAPLPADASNPAAGWIARYEAEAARERPATGAQPVGTFGVNTNGLMDIAGNVWEWTDTCFTRATLRDGVSRITNTNCGVRVVQGAHRSYMTDFIRDPKTGGCAVGVPPANLGFRLVVPSNNGTIEAIARKTRQALSFIQVSLSSAIINALAAT